MKATTPALAQAEFLVVLGPEAGVMLCQRHAEVFELIMRASTTEFQMLDISEEPEESTCQACHLAAHRTAVH